MCTCRLRFSFSFLRTTLGILVLVDITIKMADTEIKAEDDVMAGEEDGEDEVCTLNLWQNNMLILHTGGD
jgi:hypothetical protein